MDKVGSRLAFLGRDYLVYEENGRKIDVTIDNAVNIVVVFPISIGRWQDDPMTSISDAERARILESIKALLDARGLEVQISD